MPDYRVLVERKFLFDVKDVISPEAAIHHADDVFRQIDDLMSKSRYPRTTLAGTKTIRKRVIPSDIILDVPTVLARASEIKQRVLDTHDTVFYNEGVRQLNYDVVRYISSGLCPNPEEIAAAALETQLNLVDEYAEN